MRRVRTFVTWATCLIGIASVTVAPAGASLAQSPDDAAGELAERYAPVIMVQKQPEPCSSEGEPFVPMPVDAVLDNPEIALRQSGPDGLAVMWGPSASELATFGQGFFLDFPGHALDPGCGYERDARRYMEGRVPVVYAHIATQDDHPDVIALQYWFYWYFNDWNNKHESDWEGIQLLFRASSVQEALATDPESVGYAQHEGGERAEWGDDKLQREGRRPVVFTSARSHASYFSGAVYLGRSGSEGFGCDTTTGPWERLDPEVMVLHEPVDDPRDPVAWLAFEGRWGERGDGPYDSPTGLAAKARWTEPVGWHDQLRDGSVTVPGGDTPADEVIGGFCRVVGWGSQQITALQLSPVRVLTTIGLAVAAAMYFIRRTSWAVTSTSPIVRRRRAGEIVRASIAHFRAAPASYLVLGLAALPVAAVAGTATWILGALPWIGNLIDLADDGGTSRAVPSALTGSLATVVALHFMIGAVAWSLDQSDRGDVPSATATIHATRQRARTLLVVFVIAFAVVGALFATVILAPVASWLLVRWQFAPQAMMLEGQAGRRALRASSQLVRQRWWHTLLVTGMIQAFIFAAGYIVALLMLTVFRSLPLWSLTIVTVGIGVIVMPLGAIMATLLYGDARAQFDERVANDEAGVALGR